MALWIEEKYIMIIGHSLPYFKKQSNSTFTFRCPYCNDSKRRANKTRGYFFLYNKHYWFKCHNCNESKSLGDFINDKFPAYFKEFQLDKLREKEPHKFVYKPKKSLFLDSSKKTEKLSILSIAELPESHDAVKYCKNRMLPKEAFDHLYFTDRWTDFIKHNGWTYSFKEDNYPRLVLPWFSRSGAMLGAQVRRIDVSGKEGRYVTLKSKLEHEEPKIYGLDRLNLNAPVYMVEGPLDSWFVPNCVAAMGADLLKCKSECLPDYDVTYIFDNEPRNENVAAEINKAVMKNFPVVIWPSDIKEKDINDMVKSGIDVLDIIKKNTFSGLKAQLEFMRYRKC